MFWFGLVVGVAIVVSPLAYLYAKGFFDAWVKKD